MGASRLEDQTLKEEYQSLFSTCRINRHRLAEVDRIIDRLMAHETEYHKVADPLGIPWYMVALIHQMERGGSFEHHLHNGDPLDARTVNRPAGRPKKGRPPFDWDFSARDALYYMEWDRWRDWTIPGMLYLLEKYNGMGYRKTFHTNSPYLWSFCQHYLKGKYTSDGHYDPDKESKQAGTAVLLHRLLERGLIKLTEVAAAPPWSPEIPVAPPVASNSQTYAVNRGDTLWAIAQRFQVSLAALIKSNPRIENPNIIYPGQVINLPPNSVPPSGVEPPPPEMATVDYSVLPGDTLESIARRYAISLDELVRLNPLLLQPGQILQVPRAAAPPDSAPPPALEGEDPPWLKLAILEKDYYKVAELPGPAKNNRILMYHASTDQKITVEEGDPGAWCSSFVNWCVTQAGYEGTDSAASVSWLKGEKLEKPLRGCIVVLWRKQVGKDPSRGHVGFYWGEAPRNPASFLLLGGNQSDRVSIDSRKKTQVRAYLWPRKA